MGCYITHIHLERMLLAAGGSLRMKASLQYREFAADCYRLASKVKTEKHRKILQEIARQWEKLAQETEAAEAQS